MFKNLEGRGYKNTQTKIIKSSKFCENSKLKSYYLGKWDSVKFGIVCVYTHTHIR